MGWNARRVNAVNKLAATLIGYFSECCPQTAAAGGVPGPQRFSSSPNSHTASGMRARELHFILVANQQVARHCSGNEVAGAAVSLSTDPIDVACGLEGTPLTIRGAVIPDEATARRFFYTALRPSEICPDPSLSHA